MQRRVLGRVDTNSRPPRLDPELMVGADALPGLKKPLSPWRAALARHAEEMARHEQVTPNQPKMELLQLALDAAESSAAAATDDKERAEAAHVKDKARLEATITAMGEQLVSAQRDRDVEAARGARQAADAAAGRLAAAAATEALNQDWLRKFVAAKARAAQDAATARDDVVKKAQRQFDTARHEYKRQAADLAKLRRAHDAALALHHDDLSRFRAQLDAAHATIASLKRDNADLSRRLRASDAHADDLRSELADLRAISDELFDIAEAHSAVSSSNNDLSQRTEDPRLLVACGTPHALRALKLAPPSD